MSRAKRLGGLWAVVVLGWVAAAQAQNAGQADLDKANEIQVSAQSLAEFEQVIKLCESALKKGLDEGNRKYAEQLLTSTLYEHASRVSAPIFDPQAADRRWPLLRKVALADLERAIKVDPKLADAHLLIGKLQALPGGDHERAVKAAAAAAALFEGDKKKQAAAWLLRGQLREEFDERLQDFGRAIELDPANAEAWQARALAYAEQGEFEKAVADFNKLLQENKDNVTAHLALGEVLTNLEKYEEAAKHIEQAIKLKPESPLGYTLRSKLHVAQKDLKAALADLDQALKIEPRDVSALLIRARIHQEDGDMAAAKKDVNRILLIAPELPQGVIMRSILEAAEGKLVDAIADMESVLEKDPTNVSWRLQLASYYLQDKRQSKAIEIFTKIIEEDETNWMARQARADTLLSIGKQAEAIADFEISLKQRPDDDGVLNNFAWVLATSPDDKLRNGKRALELAKKACEVTQYKRSHILSTLAAAYAETGDFENAKKWSQKAVELGAKDKEVDEQLKLELKSYEEKKPWREKQQVKEKADPVQPPRSQFET